MLVKVYICMCVLSRSVVSESLQPHRLQPARLLCPWSSPGKNTGVGCPFLLQGIFLTQGPGIELTSLRSPALAGEFFTISTTWEIPIHMYILYIIHSNTL